MSLPEGWIETTLGDICTKPQYGWTTKAVSEGSFKLLRTTDITSGSIDWNSVPFCSENPTDDEKYLIQKHDILISRAGSVGFSILIESEPEYPSVFASYLIRFTVLSGLDSKYIRYFLLSSNYWNQISEHSTGIALANVNASKLTQITLPLAPLNEQQRIVAKLEAILAKVQSAQAHLESMPDLLKRTRQAILSAAVSGKLTENWRDAKESLARSATKALKTQNIKTLNPEEPYLPELPEQWSWIKLKDVGHVQTGIAKNAGKRFENPITLPYLRVANVQDGYLDLNELKEITIDLSNLERYSLKKGDILFCEGGDFDKVGRGTVWEEEIEQCVHQNHVFAVRIKEGLINPYFLSFYRNSEFAKKYFIQSAKQTTNLASINSTQLKEIFLPYCSIEEQQEIVRRVEGLFERLDRIETSYKEAKETVDNITQSTLAKAFRGELVPQDPNDEPASVLLERIKAEKDSEAKAPKEKRVPKKGKVYVENIVDSITLTDEAIDMVEHSDLVKILQDQRQDLEPKQLLDLSSYSEDTIEDFYESLRKAVLVDKKIEQIRDKIEDKILLRLK